MTKAKKGDRVRIHYTGSLADGTVFDTSRNDGPMEVTIGDNKLLADIDGAIVDMDVGGKKTIVIPPDRAFGSHQSGLVVEMPLSELPPGLTPRLNQRLQFRGPGRETISVAITALTETTITMDGNHPLAGKCLTFEIELMGILSAG